MLKYKLDQQDFQFASGHECYGYPLDPVQGSGIDLTIYSDKPFDVVLLNQAESEELFLATSVTVYTANQETLGFDRIQVLAPKRAKLAVRAWISDLQNSEKNDGIPVVLEPDTTPDMRIDHEVQLRVANDLARAGFDEMEIVEILEGLNSDENLEFDETEQPFTQAELFDLMHAQTQSAEDETSSIEDDADGHQEIDAQPEGETPD